MENQRFQDKVPHVSGDDGAADIFHAADDVAEPPDKFESRGHLTLKEHKHRAHMEKANEVEILKSEGADLPHHTHAGHVDLPGAVD